MQHGVQQIHMQSLNMMGSTYLDSTEASAVVVGPSNNLVLHASHDITTDNCPRSGDRYQAFSKGKGRRKEATRRERMEATVCHFLLSCPDPHSDSPSETKNCAGRNQWSGCGSRLDIRRRVPFAPRSTRSSRARHATPSAPLPTRHAPSRPSPHKNHRPPRQPHGAHKYSSLSPYHLPSTTTVRKTAEPDSIPLPFYLCVEYTGGQSPPCSFLVRSMCHPGLPPLPPGCSVIRRRARPAVAVAPTLVPQRQTHTHTHTHHYCVCSPTAHRGSFRCRWHRGGYVWGTGRGRAVALGAVP
jgi:hypothetical protein